MFKFHKINSKNVNKCSSTLLEGLRKCQREPFGTQEPEMQTNSTLPIVPSCSWFIRTGAAASLHSRKHLTLWLRGHKYSAIIQRYTSERSSEETRWLGVSSVIFYHSHRHDEHQQTIFVCCKVVRRPKDHSLVTNSTSRHIICGAGGFTQPLICQYPTNNLLSRCDLFHMFWF